jgi:hypothetical protein
MVTGGHMLGKRVRLAVGTLLTAFFPCLSAAQDIPGSYFSYGNWAGGAYLDSQTGAFSHCAVSASYLSGDMLIFSMSRDGVIGVGVASPALDLQPGVSFPVSIVVDRRRPYYGTAVALSSGSAAVYIEELDAALDAFRRGFTLTVEGVSMRGQYDLTGTFHALERMTRCAIDNYAYVGPRSAPESQPSNSTFDQAMLYQVATQTITSFGVRDFKFATADELVAAGLANNAVRWVARDVGVTATILAIAVADSESLRDSDAADTEFLATQCANEYITSARNLSDVEFDIREIRVMCAGDDAIVEHYVNKFRVGQHHVYTWFEFAADYAPPSGGTPQQNSATASVVAASFLLE